VHLRGAALRQLSGEQLEQLAQRLIDAERVASGLEPGDRKALEATNRGDGGIDCLLTRSPPKPTDFFRRGPLVFQFKRSYAEWGSKDVSGPARKWLRQGAGYRLIVAEELDADLQIKREQSVRRRLAKYVGRSVKDVSLVAWEGLFTWLSEHPSLWSYVPGLSPLGQLRSWDQWREEELRPAGPLPWVADGARASAAERLRRGMERGEVWRVTGPPGVGKTRFALEALRELGPAVSYLPTYGDAVMDLVGSSTPLYGVLVIDQCTEEQQRNVRRFRRAPTLSIVMIDREDDATTELNETTIRLEPLDRGAREHLARDAAPHVPLDVRLAVARESGGYPELFRLFLDAVAAVPLEHGLSGVSLRRQDLVGSLKRFLARTGEDSRALNALSLPTIVAFHQDSNDVDVLARAFGVHAADLGEMRGRLVRRHAAAEVGRSLYITPKVLGDWMALGTWRSQEPGRLIERLRDAGAGTDLISRCLRRLELATDEAHQILLELASEPRLLVDAVGPEHVGQLIGRLAERNPAAAVEISRQLVGDGGSTMTAEVWSTDLARALAKAGWFEQTFEPAARLLARAAVEIDRVDVRLLSDMFAARYAQTLAPPQRRIRFLQALASDHRPEYRHLAVSCAMAATQTQPAFALTDLPDRRSQPWRIPSADEERDYRLDAARLLTHLMTDPDDGIRKRALGSVALVLRELVRLHLTGVGVALVEGFTRAEPPLPEYELVLHVVGLIDQFDQPNLPAADREQVERIKSALRPRNLAEQVAQVLADALRPGEPAPELERTASGLVQNADPRALDYLFRVGAGEGFDLGRRAGQLDERRKLLEPIRERARRPGTSLRFAAGYLHGIEGSPTAEEVLDEWSGENALGRLVFEATWLREPSPRAAARLVRMVERKTLPSSTLEGLRWGAWLSKVPFDVARSVLRAASDEPRTAFLLALQLAQLPGGEWSVPELKEAWAVAGPLIPDRDELAWEWTEAARKIAQADSTFVVDSCIRLLRSPDTRARTHVAEVLGPLLTREPDAHWERFGRLLEDMEGQWREALGMMVRPHLRDEAALARAIVRWARTGGGIRPKLAAFLVGGVSQAEGSLGAALLDAFPGDLDVRRWVTAAFESGQFHGDESQWHLGRLRALETFAASARIGLSAWARALLPETQAQYEHAAKVEGAFRDGALEVPLHHDSPFDRLYEVALGQDWLFTTDQAQRVGCSRQLLDKYLRSGKVQKVMRGVYRLTRSPRSENEGLVAIWLRLGGQAVFSHTTALALHRLSTALPEKAHITLPETWRRRRVRFPPDVLVHHAPVPRKDCMQIGPIWVTTVERTIADCVAASVDPDIVREAIRDARERGLLPPERSGEELH